jgi:threonine dehydratase
MTYELTSQIDLVLIEQARKRIAPLVVRTPLKPSQPLSIRTGASVFLKLESMQPTGAFKLRGAANAILSLTRAEQERGIVTCSAGNHGRAVAYVARHLDIPATIFLSPLAPANKVRAIEELGARVVVAGKDFDEAAEAAEGYCVEHGMTFVHAFDDPAIVAGQGTVGLEILEDLPDVDTVIVPLSGGGLIAGIAVAVKALRSEVRIIGVSMERGPAMHASVEAGRPVSVEEETSLADALTGGIGLDNRWTFPLVRDLVDETRLVSEDEIAAAMVHALMEERIVLEGAGATPLALLLRERAGVPGASIVAVCTGDNVDMRKLLALVGESTRV